MAALSPRLSGPIALIANPAAQNGNGAKAIEAVVPPWRRRAA